MKTRIAIYGGTALSAAESWFVVSLTYSLLKTGDTVIITGGFLYWPAKKPGTISTDFSVLQGAKKYAAETGTSLDKILETWLPDPVVENDPDKKEVIRFKEGVVKELKGESARIRRFSMVKDVDVLITVKGSKHTEMVLEFASNINKPALPLAFTGGDSEIFWTKYKDKIKNWFGITDAFEQQMEIKDIDECQPPVLKILQDNIIAAVRKAGEKESENEIKYKAFQEELEPATPLIIKEIAGNDSVNEVPAPKQLKMFLSYSHKDAALKEALDTHLTALKRSNRISVWDDGNIEGGTEWDKSIKKELTEADIILLLISPDFIASNYIWNIELDYALKKHEKGEAKVIPIFMRNVFSEGLPFLKLQGHISLDKPVTSFKVEDRDTAFRDIVKAISDDINKWLKL